MREKCIELVGPTYTLKLSDCAVILAHLPSILALISVVCRADGQTLGKRVVGNEQRVRAAEDVFWIFSIPVVVLVVKGVHLLHENAVIG